MKIYVPAPWNLCLLTSKCGEIGHLRSINNSANWRCWFAVDPIWRVRKRNLRIFVACMLFFCKIRKFESVEYNQTHQIPCCLPKNSRTFKDLRTCYQIQGPFQGLEKLFWKSRTFKDFKNPQEPCLSLFTINKFQLIRVILLTTREEM